MDRHWLAADFFLIAHDEFSGKLRISLELLCCGLVGGQLADLIVANRLAVEGGRVLVTDDRSEARDEVGDYVVESISRQTSTHSVRVWVETLQEVLYELIGRREQGGRQLMRRRPDRFPATDLLAAARPRLRLEHMLRTPQEFDLPGAILAVLVGAVGVETVLDPEIDRTAARELMTRLEENFPADLRALIEGVRAAAVAVSLTVRR
jgi:Golgi phosphoprotein 3 (GPP34)